MIKVSVYKKSYDGGGFVTGKLIEERVLHTLYDLETYISRVSASDIKFNDYHIQKSQRVLEFFKRTYYAHFYVEFYDYIGLCKLYHSQKRLKNNTKKTNSNKILENTLLRIQTYLNKEMRNQRAKATVIMPRLTGERYEKIKIQIDDQVNSHFFEIEFDKTLWLFKIISVKTTRPNFIKIISKAIRYTTTPTRVYREKNKVIENENYSK
jgi:hypothetical protein